MEEKYHDRGENRYVLHNGMVVPNGLSGSETWKTHAGWRKKRIFLK